MQLLHIIQQPSLFWLQLKKGCRIIPTVLTNQLQTQFSNFGKLLEILGKTDISVNVFKIAINPHSMLVRNLKKVLKFIYSQKATKFFKISPLLLTALHTVKIKGKISQNFVAFSEYMHFKDMDRTFAG